MNTGQYAVADVMKDSVIRTIELMINNVTLLIINSMVQVRKPYMFVPSNV